MLIDLPGSLLPAADKYEVQKELSQHYKRLYVYSYYQSQMMTKKPFQKLIAIFYRSSSTYHQVSQRPLQRYLKNNVMSPGLCKPSNLKELIISDSFTLLVINF
jgi:hypothetical protein